MSDNSSAKKDKELIREVKSCQKDLARDEITIADEFKVLVRLVRKFCGLKIK